MQSILRLIQQPAIPPLEYSQAADGVVARHDPSSGQLEVVASDRLVDEQVFDPVNELHWLRQS